MSAPPEHHPLGLSKSAALLTPLPPLMENVPVLPPNSSMRKPNFVSHALPTKSMMLTKRLASALLTSPPSTLLDGAHALLPAGGMKRPMLVTLAQPTRSMMLILKLASALLDLPTSTPPDSVSPVTLPQYGTPTPSPVSVALLD